MVAAVLGAGRKIFLDTRMGSAYIVFSFHSGDLLFAPLDKCAKVTISLDAGPWPAFPFLGAAGQTSAWEPDSQP